MESLLNLTELNVPEIYDAIDLTNMESVMRTLAIFIDSVPNSARPLGMLLTLLIQAKPEMRQPVVDLLSAKSDDKIVLMSRLIHSGCMGASVALSVDDPVSDILSDVKIPHKIPAEFSKAARAFSKTVSTSSKRALLDVSVSHAIIQKFNFSKAETLYRLKDKSHQAIIESMLIAETDADIGIISDLCRRTGFLEALAASIARFTRRTHIVGIIFLGYFSTPRHIVRDQNSPIATPAARDCFVSMFTLEAEQFCRRIGSVEMLNELLGRDYMEPHPRCARYKEYDGIKFATTDEFFTAFLELSSPTPTHFLSYLEFYRSRFAALSESEGKEFIKALKAFHKNNEPFLEIVIPRLRASELIAGWE